MLQGHAAAGVLGVAVRGAHGGVARPEVPAYIWSLPLVDRLTIGSGRKKDKKDKKERKEKKDTAVRPEKRGETAHLALAAATNACYPC